MKDAHHLANGMLIRYLDGELAEAEYAQVRAHVTACQECRRKRDEFARVSFRVDGLVGAQPAGESTSTRDRLVAALRSESASTPKVMKRFMWGMAVAATLALGILVAPRPRQRPVAESSRPVESAAAHTTSFDVNGESFIALPYSNPELPMSAPRIVEMQVPVSSLAAAGIFFQPVATGNSGDRTVLANVVLGIDGQPLGVHVLSAE